MRRFQCPSCDRQLAVDDIDTRQRMHPCKKLAGMLAPFVEITGLELNPRVARHLVVEREDYIGSELVQYDGNGRPVMAVITERADGSNDRIVFPAQATGH